MFSRFFTCNSTKSVLPRLLQNSYHTISSNKFGQDVTIDTIRYIGDKDKERSINEKEIILQYARERLVFCEKNNLLFVIVHPTHLKNNISHEQMRCAINAFKEKREPEYDVFDRPGHIAVFSSHGKFINFLRPRAMKRHNENKDTVLKFNIMNLLKQYGDGEKKLGTILFFASIPLRVSVDSIEWENANIGEYVLHKSNCATKVGSILLNDSKMANPVQTMLALLRQNCSQSVYQDILESTILSQNLLVMSREADKFTETINVSEQDDIGLIP